MGYLSECIIKSLIKQNKNTNRFKKNKKKEEEEEE
jgi:hypothetical protein